MLAPTRVFRQFDLPEGGKGADNFFFKNKKTPRSVHSSNFTQHQKTGRADQNQPDDTGQIHNGEIARGRGLGRGGRRGGAGRRAALRSYDLDLGGGLIHLDSGVGLLGAGGGAGGGWPWPVLRQRMYSARRRQPAARRRPQKRPHKKSASSRKRLLNFSFLSVWKRCSNVHVICSFLYCSTAQGVRQAIAKK